MRNPEREFDAYAIVRGIAEGLLPLSPISELAKCYTEDMKTSHDDHGLMHGPDERPIALTPYYVFPKQGYPDWPGTQTCWGEESALAECAKEEPIFGTMLAKVDGYLVEFKDNCFIGAGQDDEVRI